MKRKSFLVTIALLIVFAIVSAGSSGAHRAHASTALSATSATEPASPQADLGMAFTYQGKLDDAGLPANGQYDFEFKLYDALVGGTQTGDTVGIGNVTVADGLFTVTPDFGSTSLVFNGSPSFLQIAVRPAGGGTYTTLTPRQAITATPYASSLTPGAFIEANDLPATLFLRNHSLGGIGLSVYSDQYHAISARSGTSIAVDANTQDANAIKAENWSVTNATISAHNFADGYGVEGASTEGAGIYGTGQTGLYGVGTRVGNANGVGVQGRGNGTGGIGVYGSGATGVYGTGFGDGGAGVYAYGTGGAKAGSFTGDVFVSGKLDAHAGAASNAIFATTDGATSTTVYASNSSSGTGVLGGSANGGVGVYGQSGGADGAGIYGVGLSGADAGYFLGDVGVLGNLSKGGGSFKIDSPLDPENKYLYHSFVESPDMMNVYNGNITTDSSGNATVTLPDYFNALNRDYRYQLTVMGQQFAQAIVSSKVDGNKFSIKTDKPNIEVSWQVTGIRQDPYANANRIPVEVDKAPDDKGKYLYPALYGKSADLQIGPKLPPAQPAQPVLPVENKSLVPPVENPLETPGK